MVTREVQRGSEVGAGLLQGLLLCLFLSEPRRRHPSHERNSPGDHRALGALLRGAAWGRRGRADLEQEPRGPYMT